MIRSFFRQARKPEADIRFYDTGHFALETHAGEIIPVIRSFLDAHVRNENT